MKKIFFNTVLMIFVISFFANNLFAQKSRGTTNVPQKPIVTTTTAPQKFFVTVNAQYGFRTKNSYNDYNYTETSTKTTAENINSSLGNGLNAGGALGYMFTKNIGAEVGISYFSGDKNKKTVIFTNYKSSVTHSSNMLQINPSLIISAGLKKINPYAKFGYMIGSGSILREYNENKNGDITLMKFKYTDGLALGLNASVGVLYSLNDNISLFGQVNMTDMTYAPTKGERTEWTVNGVDQLPNATVNQKQIEYVDSYTEDSNNPQPDSQPYKDLKRYYPFNSFGFSLGLKYGF